MDFLAQAQKLTDEITQLRHELHQHPEVGLELPWTRERVLQALAGLPLEITLAPSDSAIFAVLRGGAADPDLTKRPVVLLRADMDALPLQEEADVSWKSQIDGKMHACGHDVHTATLVGGAKLLCQQRDSLQGDIVFFFQTAEELVCGARSAIKDGVLDVAGKRVDRAYGTHVFSGMFPVRTFQTRAGTLMAAADGLLVDIIGKGGHGSMPEKTIDPVPAMAEVITAVQMAVTRKFSAFHPVVVNVGVANAGGAANVVPESCHLEISIRTNTVADRKRAEELFPQLVTDIATTHGCRAELKWISGVAPAICDGDAAEFAIKTCKKLFGEDRVPPMELPLAGSEDFAEVMAEVPGAFVCYSGTPVGEEYTDYNVNHSATAWFDDCVITEAMALYAQLGYDQCAELAGLSNH